MSKKQNDAPPNTPMPKAVDLLGERGLPASPDTERFVLGSVLLGGSERLSEISLTPEDFSLEKHRRIFARMKDLADRGEKVDRVTLANELMRMGQIESVDGFSYLASLDEGLPALVNLDAYVRIVAEKSRLRQIIFAAQKTIDRALIQEASSTDLTNETTNKLLEIAATANVGQELERTPTQVVENFPGGVSTFLDPTLRPHGLSTGFTQFDNMTGGLLGGQVMILAARPSHGKTAMALNIAAHLTMHPKQRRHVAVFSLEMSAATLLTRLLCATARVDAHKFRQGYLNPDERRKLQVAFGEIQEAHLFINDEASLTMTDISRKIRRLHKEHGIHVAIIDYLGLIAPQGRSENKNQEISIVTRQTKLLAKELDIPIIMLCQLSRQTERRGDARPVLSDLRDSGSIEQDADIVAFIFREELHKKDREDLRGIADLIISKQRDGPVGVVPLRFLGQFTRFENRAEDIQE